MRNQIVKDIIKVSVDEPKVYYVIETKDKSYNCYHDIKYGDKCISFIDEDGNAVILEYKYIVGVKVRVI